MPTREETARAFADAMGWTRDPTSCVTHIPAAGAPLHEHLAFVGRVAEALNAFPTVTCGNVGKRTAEGYRVQYEAHVAFDMPHIVDGVCYGQASADDPSWAAMLAAIAAKEFKS